MRLIADFHFHSRFSRACSKDLTIPNLEKIAAFKGVHLLGTGDFTHPAWMAEIKKYLQPAEGGLYATSSESKVRFIPTVEISSIYSQGGPSATIRASKTRRVHTVFVMPSIESAEKFTQKLLTSGAKLSSDGRPIVGISAHDLAAMALDADSRAVVIPAHIWTPWFAMFGSMSGFDSVEECFGDVAKQIFALEMGMSSDAAMNWRVSQLDRYALLASSDAHSLHRIGRESNVFEIADKNKLSYDWIYNSIKYKDPKIFLYTIKYYPQEGRYHYDGHADCNFSCLPQETKRLHGLCPRCGRKLTIGVLARVEELADPSRLGRSEAGRQEGYIPPNAIPTIHLVPLEEVIAEALDRGVGTKTVQVEYQRLVTAAGGEYEALLDRTLDELKKITQPVIVEAIRRVRAKKLYIEPGYDGKYGVVKIFTPEERAKFVSTSSNQSALF